MPAVRSAAREGLSGPSVPALVPRVSIVALVLRNEAASEAAAVATAAASALALSKNSAVSCAMTPSVGKELMFHKGRRGARGVWE